MATAGICTSHCSSHNVGVDLWVEALQSLLDCPVTWRPPLHERIHPVRCDLWIDQWFLSYEMCEMRVLVFLVLCYYQHYLLRLLQSLSCMRWHSRFVDVGMKDLIHESCKAEAERSLKRDMVHCTAKHSISLEPGRSKMDAGRRPTYRW